MNIGQYAPLPTMTERYLLTRWTQDGHAQEFGGGTEEIGRLLVYRRAIRSGFFNDQTGERGQWLIDWEWLANNTIGGPNDGL